MIDRTPESLSRPLKRLQAAGQLLAASVLVLVVLNWVGWGTGDVVLTSWNGAWAAMPPWTSLMLGIVAILVMLQPRVAVHEQTRFVAAILAVGVSVLAMVFIGTRVAGALPMDLDTVWFPEAVTEIHRSRYPGRPGITLSIAVVVLAGIAMLPDRRWPWLRRVWPVALLLASMAPQVSVASYVLGVPFAFSRTGPADIAMQSGVCLLALVFAVVAIRLSSPSLAWFIAGPYRWSLLRAAVLITAMLPTLLVMRALLVRGFQMDERDALALAIAPTTVILSLVTMLVGARTWQQHFLTDYAADASFITSSDGLFEWVSPSTRKLTGWHPRALVGRPLREFVHPDDVAALEGAASGSGGEGVQFEARLRLPNGGHLWVATSLGPILDGSGRPVGHAGSWRDIDAKVAAEDEAQRIAADRARLIARLPVGVIKTTGHLDAGVQRVVFLSERAAELLGTTVAEAIAEPWHVARAFAPEERADCRERFLAAAAAGEDFSWEGRTKGRGPASWLRIEGTITATEGRSSVFEGIIQDISRAKEDEAKLLDARATAERAAVAKAAFLANMTHEIRTPLSAVLGFTELLAGSDLSPAQRAYVARAERAGHGVLTILNDVLDYSKLEANSLQLDVGPVVLEDLFADVGVVMAGLLGDKPLDLFLDLDPDLPPLVVADGLRLRQVLVNLAGNAIKFTRTGEVLVAARLAGTDEGRATVDFTVRDTGIGMTDEEAERVFAGYAQADAATARRYGGTGLGLSVSRALVELMGGRLTVASSPGEGSTFSFRLSLPLAPLRPQPQTHDPAYRVLVVSDSPTGRDVAARLCRGLGWDAVVTTWADAQPLTQGSPSDEYDLVLVDDGRVPDLGRVETVIGPASHAPGDRPWMIAMSNEAGRPRWEACPAVDAVVVQPFTASALLEAVADARVRAEPLAEEEGTSGRSD